MSSNISFNMLQQTLEDSTAVEFERERDALYCRIGEKNYEVEDIADLKMVLAKGKSKDGLYQFIIYPGQYHDDNENEDA